MELALKIFNMKTCAWVADQIESQCRVKNIEKVEDFELRFLTNRVLD